MTVTVQLYQLEELDSETEREEETLAEEKARLGDRKLLDTAQARLDAAKSSLDDLKRQHRSAEAEVDDIISRINGEEGKLYGGKVTSPKELSSLQHEVSLMKTRNDELENKTLEIIEKVEETEQNVAAITAAFDKLQKDWQAEQERLTAEIEKLTASLTTHNKQRQTLAAQIESSSLTLYDRIRKQKKPAVSRVEQGICRSCRTSPSSSAMQRARAGQAITCDCGRILYIP
ncbi:MAG: hypothetical protein MUO19_02365 [Dehalococcoidales bacterium]|nr:hypothetical protein [Dehalococcoidales bacterium]